MFEREVFFAKTLNFAIFAALFQFLCIIILNSKILKSIQIVFEKIGFYQFFHSKLSSRNFGQPATLSYLAAHILCMAILDGWVQNRLPSEVFLNL